MKTDVLITDNTPVFPGDILKLYYNVFSERDSYTRAIQLATIEGRLEDHKDSYYRVMSWQQTDHQLIFEVEVLNGPPEKELEIQRAGLGVGTIILLFGTLVVAGMGIYSQISHVKTTRETEMFKTQRVETLSKTAEGRLHLAAPGLFGVAAVALVVYLIWKRR